MNLNKERVNLNKEKQRFYLTTKRKKKSLSYTRGAWEAASESASVRGPGA